MFQRVELHNHSTHSDGALTVQQLAEYAAQQQFGVLALTDHNTVSGHQPLREAIAAHDLKLQMLPGVEVTTFYGHVLALGLNRMIDQTTIDPDCPEQLFHSLRAAGAGAVGIAHPFCIGEPVMMGCRFTMNLRNWSAVDYIEIFNTSSEESGKLPPEIEQAFSGNRQALELWEDLVLSGCRIAAVTGKDLHRLPNKTDVFKTYVWLRGQQWQSMQTRVLDAILRQKTLVTKGPLFRSVLEKGTIKIAFENTSSEPLVLQLRYGNGQTQEMPVQGREMLVMPPKGFKTAVLKVYRDACRFENLLAVGWPIYE